MGYLYDDKNQTYVHEAYCDENGNYDPDLVNEGALHKAYAERRAKLVADQEDKRNKKARAVNAAFRDRRSALTKEEDRKRFEKERNTDKATKAKIDSNNKEAFKQKYTRSSSFDNIKFK